MDAAKRPHRHKSRQRNFKKRRRNYRWLGEPRSRSLRSEQSVTKYRARHGIPPGSRKELHAAGKCPVHSKN